MRMVLAHGVGVAAHAEAGILSVSLFKEPVLLLCCAGFTEPGATYRVDMAAESCKAELFRQTQLKVPHNPADYETKQVGGHGPTLSSHAVATYQLQIHSNHSMPLPS
jgi:hypothetical protein